MNREERIAEGTAEIDRLESPGPTDQDLASLQSQVTSQQQTVQSAVAAIPSAEAALAAQDHRSSPRSVVLLGASLLILLALAAGVAVRWWTGRSDRYWPA